MMSVNNCFSRLYFFIVFSIFTFSAFTQSIMVTGTVIDELKEGMPGVTIKIEGNPTGTTTDLDGKYTISINDKNNILIFSFIGYKNQAVFHLDFLLDLKPR